MPYREVRVVDYQEVLRRWLAGDGIRPISRATGLDRKTVSKYVVIALGMGLQPGDPWPEEKVVADFIRGVKHPRPAMKPGGTEEVLLERKVQIQEWLDQDLLDRIKDMWTQRDDVYSRLKSARDTIEERFRPY